VQSGYNKAMAAGLSADRIPSKVWMNYKQFKDIWEIEPYLYAHVKSLSGDTSDSIKSPGGLGEKTALKLVVKYGELADIEAQVEDLEVPRLTKNAHEELKRDFNQIWFNFKLVNLNHDREGYVEIIGEDGVQYLDQVIQDFESKGRVDVNEIEELMFRDGKVGLADKINQWLYPFQK
jgi:5'-3' exonuclease